MQSDETRRAHAGAYGKRLAKCFGLGDVPAFITRSLDTSTIAVTHIRCDLENNGLTAPIPVEDAYLITLQLRECPSHDLWIAGKPRTTAHLARGTTCIYDLRTNPIANSISPFRQLHFYLPRTTLIAICEQDGLRSPETLENNPGIGVSDPVIASLGFALEPLFRLPEEATNVFVDHVTIAVAAHVARIYGNRGPASENATAYRLSTKQVLRATQLLDADPNISLPALASTCGMGSTPFKRAFQRTTGLLPHHWLIRRRIDKAVDLLRRTQSPLPVVANICGFASAGHMQRCFVGLLGVPPERYRD